jgi:multiple sugar transport system permease protein
VDSTSVETTDAGISQGGQGRLRRNGSDHLLGLLIAVSAIFTAIVIVVPLVSGIALSFYKISSFNVGAAPRFVGFDNFVRVVASEAFHNAFKNDIFFTVCSVAIQTILAILIALSLNSRVPLAGFFRAVVVLPMLVPPVVITTIDRWVTNESFGIVAVVMMKMGLQPIGWNTPAIAMWHVIGLGVWLWLPFMTLSILAELQSIPASLYEAAKVDGANRVQQFFHITLPHLMSVLGIIVLLRSIWTFNNFELIYLATGGGPIGMTETLPILAYRQSFTLFNIGGGAATSTLSFLFLLAIVLGVFRFLAVTKR